MSDPPSYDDDLLARLNALKQSSLQLNPSRSQPFDGPSRSSPEVDLSARLRSLRNASLSHSSTPAAKALPVTSQTVVSTSSLELNEDVDPLRTLDDQTLDDLLADLGPDDQWKLDADDPEDIQKLLDEARKALPRDGDGQALLSNANNNPIPDKKPQYNDAERIAVATKMLKVWAGDCAQLAYSNSSRRMLVPYAIFMKDEYIQELAQMYAVSGDSTTFISDFWDQLSLEYLRECAPLLQSWKHWDKFSVPLLGELKFMPDKIEAEISKRYDEKSESKAIIEEKPSGAQSKDYLTRDLDTSAFALDDDDATRGSTEYTTLEHESQEAQDIVARLLDEVKLERQYEFEIPDEEPSTKHDEGEDAGFTLPSAPSKLPESSATEPSRNSIEFESDIAARMAALKGLGAINELGLPSAPTSKPADKPVKNVQKKFTDDEIESWCIICQDDATVKCTGCEGDLYCANCWKEGHMGPDVGYEERMHKWAKYRKPK